MLLSYATVLWVHSWLRWGVVCLAVLCLVRAARGWVRRAPFADVDARLQRLFVGAVDAQLLHGVLLYALLSPITAVGFSNLGAAMRNSVLRFFVLEHPLAMLIAVVVVHVGLLWSRRFGADPRRHRAVLRTTAVALLCFIIGIPWPGLPYVRPLLRL